MALYQEGDLLQVGKLAEEVTDQRVGRQVYYSINRHINYTNVCRYRCGFCGFSRRAEDEDAYTMSAYEVADQAEEAWREGATEVHIVGGVNEELGFDYYLEMLSRIQDMSPGLHVKAFTAVEIVDLAAKAGKSVEKTLKILMDFGLASLPGGGAEILSDAYFETVCLQKPKPTQWLGVHRTAHRLGLMTNATMLFGYVESIEDRVRHLLRLRELQDESLAGGGGKFQCFVPLPFINSKSEILNSKHTSITEIQNNKHEQTQQENNMPKLRVGMPPRGEERRGPQAHPTDEARPRRPWHTSTPEMNVVDELKTVAISRLLLDNFEHIKAFWPMLGAQTAQMALCFGADDLDGTVQEYRIVEQNSPTHDERGNSTGFRTYPNELSAAQIRSVIEETARKPVQRDGWYNPINDA